MKIYFFINPDMFQRKKNFFSHVLDEIKNVGLSVNNNFQFEPSENLKQNDFSSDLIENSDAFIIEGTYPSIESGHLVALCIASKKPILYLMEGGHDADRGIVAISKNKEASQFLKIENYGLKNLSIKIMKFLSASEGGLGIQIPNIKFTLRITSRIEKYLSWKSQKIDKSKADFLRELIDKSIHEDKDFKM